MAADSDSSPPAPISHQRQTFADEPACVEPKEQRTQPWDDPAASPHWAYLLMRRHREAGLHTGCSTTTTARAGGWRWRRWEHVFIRRVRTCRSGETSAEEDVADAALRTKGGERDRSPRLWQRSGPEPARARRGRGRVEQGLASATGVPVRQEREDEEAPVGRSRRV